ncbi:MAG: alpha/beta fold hydrolase [Alphaproteobacteria bacterium]
MSVVPSKLLTGGLAANRTLASGLANGFDWLFRRDSLIKSGKTWFELVHDSDLMSVRYYGLPDESEVELPDGSKQVVERNKHKVPLVLVPPLGVTTNTFDLMPERSLARYMAARGFETYLVDWGKPGKDHADYGLYDYAGRMMGEAMETIRAHSGSQDLSMMGWCMGGLLILLHQGMAQDPHIKNIITIASPIDLNSGSAVAGFTEYMDAPAKIVDAIGRLRGRELEAEKFVSPGWMTTLSFKMTDPIGAITTYWDLISQITDREFVVSHTTKADYLDNMLAYPGGVVKDLMTKVAPDNAFAQGEIELGDGNIASLKDIETPMLIFAGKTDKIVEPQVAKALVDVVASEDKQYRLAPGGHMGVILGRGAFNEVWGPSADWLIERSAA